MRGQVTGEDNETAEPARSPGALLSTMPASASDRKLAYAVLGLSTLIFAVTAPFARVPLAPVPAFLPVYQSALIANELITAVLLYGQYNILRSRALLVLASAYLFSALMAAAHMLSFPGLFAPGGLLSAGAQTTAWMYFLWHAVFPLGVIGYALLRDQAPSAKAGKGGTRPMIVVTASIGTVVLVVSGFVLLTTAGHDALPVIMRGDRDETSKIIVAAACWTFSLAAFGFLWPRHRTLLDLWLMVVMCAWVFEVALAAALNAGRFDVGWYAGRIYGLLAGSFVLFVLLLENGALYARLVEAFEGERRERTRAQEKTDELTAVNRELDAFSFSVSHDLRSPARAVEGFAMIIEEQYSGRLDAEGRRLLGVVRESAQRMNQLIEDLLAFARLGRQPLKTRKIELDALVNQTITELVAMGNGRRIDFAVGSLGAAEADPALVKQVFVNLLGNAIKFTRDRDPAVIEVGRDSGKKAERNADVYYVKDNGAGFDMTYSHRLFGVFQRLHGENEYEGTGVGLAIVHRIISRHGGRIWAHSAPGSGATFYFTLGPEHA